jgi:hypothetical protein
LKNPYFPEALNLLYIRTYKNPATRHHFRFWFKYDCLERHFQKIRRQD